MTATVDPAGAPLIDPADNPFPPPGAGAGDTPPGGRANSQANPANPPAAKRRPRKAKVSDAQIRDALSDVLTSPGVVYSIMKMDWAAEHVFRTGPDFADALVAYSKTNEWLRAKLEALARGDNAMGVIIAVYALATAGASYIVPQLAYFGLIPKEIGDRVAGASIPNMPVPVPPPFVPTPDDPAAHYEGT